jgi:taurine dioxygenase
MKTCLRLSYLSSIAFWHDRGTKHLAVHGAGPFQRIMRRMQICGDAVY